MMSPNVINVRWKLSEYAQKYDSFEFFVDYYVARKHGFEHFWKLWSVIRSREMSKFQK